MHQYLVKISTCTARVWDKLIHLVKMFLRKRLYSSCEVKQESAKRGNSFKKYCLWHICPLFVPLTLQRSISQSYRRTARWCFQRINSHRRSVCSAEHLCDSYKIYEEIEAYITGKCLCCFQKNKRQQYSRNIWRVKGLQRIPLIRVSWKQRKTQSFLQLTDCFLRKSCFLFVMRLVMLSIFKKKLKGKGLTQLVLK